MKHVDEYPTVPVYLAREVIRFHYGTIHVGQGLDGPELNIALKSRKVEAVDQRTVASRPSRSETVDELAALREKQTDNQGPDVLPASA